MGSTTLSDDIAFTNPSKQLLPYDQYKTAHDGRRDVIGTVPENLRLRLKATLTRSKGERGPPNIALTAAAALAAEELRPEPKGRPSRGIKRDR